MMPQRTGAVARPKRIATPRATDFLDLSGVANILGVTDRTVRIWISEGRLPAYRVGGRLIRVRRSDVDAMLEPIPAAGGAA